MSPSNSIPIIDTDTHITEPPDLWVSRVSKKWGDLVPHVRESDPNAEQGMVAKLQGTPEQDLCWYTGNYNLGSATATAMAGFSDRFPEHPKSFEEAHPGSYDAAQRLLYMDEVGIAVQGLYPNMALLSIRPLLEKKEPELILECARAYNDFQLDWIAPAPKRFIPIALVPFWDVEAGVSEVQRAAAAGHKALLFPGSPQSYGTPCLADRQWDPIWATAQECGLPVCFHIGSGEEPQVDPDEYQAFGPKSFLTRQALSLFLDNCNHIGDLLLSGILPRFPELEFVSVESGIGALPFALEAIDYNFLNTKAYQERPEFDMKPSEYFKRQVYASYWFEETTPEFAIDVIGADRILFETDFPHTVCLYGREEIEGRIEAGLGKQPESVKRRILHDNAAELFGLEV